MKNEYDVFVNALSTSQKNKKKTSWIDTYKDFLEFDNLAEYYVHAEKAFTDKTTANYQVPHEYVGDFLY